MKTLVKGLAALMVSVALAGSALAHTTLRSSEPASGSALNESPPAISLTFRDPARLTSLVLVTAAGERSLAFTPSENALTFVAAKPALEPGRNEVRWKALSRDGHVIEGSIILILRSPARPGA